jgi:membrane-associated protease RseP (regulator of RpoE activity)
VNYNIPQGDIGQYLRKGYTIIGISNFNSGEIKASSQSKLKEAAKDIGAEVVLWNQVYTNTVSGTTAYNYYTPQTQTSNYSGNISNNYRPMSSYNYSGSITTYSQVQNTAYVPYSIRRYNYSATFFGKLKDIKLGFFVRNLSNEERVEKHLNSGVYTFIIMEDGPASNSELAEGDIIIKVGDKKIKNIDDIITFKHESLEKVKIEFLRDGQKKTTTLNLKEIKK